MLIHITPRFICCRQSGPNVSLADLTIAELGLTLIGGTDIVSRRPFPNKTHVVACRKAGLKAVVGIFIESPARLSTFTVVSRWAISNKRLVTHRLSYTVLDEELDAVTDNMAFWRPYYCKESGELQPSRWPASAIGQTPSQAKPRMELTPREDVRSTAQDFVMRGCIVERTEVFHMPTVSKTLLTQAEATLTQARMPTLESAFHPDMPLDLRPL